MSHSNYGYESHKVDNMRIILLAVLRINVENKGNDRQLLRKKNESDKRLGIGDKLSGQLL